VTGGAAVRRPAVEALCRPRVACLAVLGMACSATSAQGAETRPRAGHESARAIAFDAARGNCLACHAIDDGTPAGTVGPALSGLATRFPSRAALYAFLWDPRATRPHAMMPPYGRNGILSARELAELSDWLWTL